MFHRWWQIVVKGTSLVMLQALEISCCRLRCLLLLNGLASARATRYALYSIGIASLGPRWCRSHSTEPERSCARLISTAERVRSRRVLTWVQAPGTATGSHKPLGLPSCSGTVQRNDIIFRRQIRDRLSHVRHRPHDEWSRQS